MSAIGLFWTGVACVVVAVLGLILGLIRASGTADENTRRALAQERAARAGVEIRTGNVTVQPRSDPSERSAG